MVIGCPLIKVKNLSRMLRVILSDGLNWVDEISRRAEQAMDRL